MKPFVYLTMLLASCFAAEVYNFAPKVLNSFEEKKIVVCIPSYKNEDYFERNLGSVFDQKYKNYRVMYVDDNSPDNTYECVKNYIIERKMGKRVKLFRNEKNQGAMFNLYHMIHQCDDDEIIVTLDGDDWFAHRNVLKRINQAYLDPEVWVTYGTYKNYPSGKVRKGLAVRRSVLENGAHRKEPFRWTHTRTFYAGLFKMIPNKLFKDDEGKFFAMAWDVAIMTNLFDLSREHVYCLSDVTYVYNVETPLNDFKKDLTQQIETEKLILTRPPLEKLEYWSP